MVSSEKFRVINKDERINNYKIHVKKYIFFIFYSIREIIGMFVLLPNHILHILLTIVGIYRYLK